MHNNNHLIRAEVFKRANASFPDPGVGKDVQYRDPGRGGISDSMLITDPNTGEIFRRGGGRSINQELAMKPGKPKNKKQASVKEQPMGLRRRAGDALTSLRKGALDLDSAFSKRIVNMYVGPEDNPRNFGKNKLTEALAGPAGLASIYAGGTPLSARGNKETAPGATYTSAAAKYAAPVVGATMAGMALVDLTARFGGPADEPEPMTLPM